MVISCDQVSYAYYGNRNVQKAWLLCPSVRMNISTVWEHRVEKLAGA